MRHLKTLPNAEARELAQCLYGAGIDVQVRDAAGGGAGVWVMDEEDVTRSRSLLEEFELSPNSPRLKSLREEAELRRRAVEATKHRQARHREVDVRTRWRSGPRRGVVSLVLIVICVLVFLITEQGDKRSVVQLFTIATLREVQAGQPFASLVSGQVWRLLTPIFVHFGLPHILFNMLWLHDLGSALEAHRGALFLVAMVCLVGVGSNLAQYVIVGYPHFGGMSGVVYGMLGYVWLRGRFDPRSGLQLSRPIVILMLGWMLLGFFGLMQMANIAHLSGLLLGCAWGYWSSGDILRRLRR